MIFYQPMWQIKFYFVPVFYRFCNFLLFSKSYEWFSSFWVIWEVFQARQKTGILNIKAQFYCYLLTKTSNLKRRLSCWKRPVGHCALSLSIIVLVCTVSSSLYCSSRQILNKIDLMPNYSLVEVCLSSNSVEVYTVFSSFLFRI